MIECPICKIRFSPRHQVCPICKRFRAKLEDRMEYLANQAERALDAGTEPMDVETMLVDEGIPSLVASEIVIARARKVMRAERSYGLFRLIGGSLILLFAGVLAFLGLLALPTRTAFHLFLFAFFVGAAGARPFFLGLYSVVTGREKQERITQAIAHHAPHDLDPH